MARALLRALDLCLSFGLGRSIPFAGCALGLGQRRSELDRAKVQKAKPVLGGSKGSVLHEGVCLTIRTLGNPGSAGLGLGLGCLAFPSGGPEALGLKAGASGHKAGQKGQGNGFEDSIHDQRLPFRASGYLAAQGSSRLQDCLGPARTPQASAAPHCKATESRWRQPVINFLFFSLPP